MKPSDSPEKPKAAMAWRSPPVIVNIERTSGAEGRTHWTKRKEALVLVSKRIMHWSFHSGNEESLWKFNRTSYLAFLVHCPISRFVASS
jgi:hypothetical protein